MPRNMLLFFLFLSSDAIFLSWQLRVTGGWSLRSSLTQLFFSLVLISFFFLPHLLFVHQAAGAHITRLGGSNVWRSIHAAPVYVYALFFLHRLALRCVCMVYDDGLWRWKGFAKKRKTKTKNVEDPTRLQVSCAFPSGRGRSLSSSFFFLLHDDVRCREEDGQRGDDGEHGENEEADAIDDHSGKLPFGDEIVFVVLLL